MAENGMLGETLLPASKIGQPSFFVSGGEVGMITFVSASWLSAAGIAWDFAGAIALSRGYFFMNDDQAKRLSGSYYGASVPAIRSMAEMRLETKFGLAQLLLGFGLQLLAACGLGISLLLATIIALYDFHRVVDLSDAVPILGSSRLSTSRERTRD